VVHKYSRATWGEQVWGMNWNTGHRVSTYSASTMRLSSPLLLLWAFPFRGQAEEGLASTEIKTGFYVVFEHMTATDCIPNQHACHAQQHEIWQTDKGEQGSAAAHTYPTVIPQICPTGWENVTYIITDTAAATETTPSWGNSGKPPPGFTVMTTECRVCGPTPTVVTVTVPHRGSRVPPRPEVRAFPSLPSTDALALVAYTTLLMLGTECRKVFDARHRM